MPAYRSEAEGDVRNAVIAKLRLYRPEARIIHEISNGMSNRFDLVAVSPAELIAVEIKSEKDTLDLLAAQIKGMKAVAHHVIVAYHRKHKPKGDAIYADAYWRYPEEPETKDEWGWQWREPRHTIQKTLPEAALGMVWKDELLTICRNHNIKALTSYTCETLRTAIMWGLTGSERTKAICAALRTRNCCEADGPALSHGGE